MRRGYRLVLVGVVGLVLVGCGSDDEFEATLSGEAERPTPVSTSASGEVLATLEELTLTVAGNFEGLSGPATAAHIHGPATEEEAAGILCPLVATADRSGTVIGTCTLTEAQVDQLEDGLMYVNVHTAANPAGEIRGQLE